MIMIYVNNVFIPLIDFKVTYYNMYNSFCFLFYDYDDDDKNIDGFKIINECYNYNQILEIINKAYNIGKQVDKLLKKTTEIVDYIYNTKKNLKIYKKSNKTSLTPPDCINVYAEYEIIKQFISDLKPPYSEEKTSGGTEIIDNVNEEYIKKVHEIYISLIEHKDIKKPFQNIFLDFNFFNERINQMFKSNFSGVKSEYRDLTRSITSFIKKFGLPNFIDTNSKEQYKEFVDFAPDKLYNNIIVVTSDFKKINQLTINLNDFIYTCYLIYMLYNLKKTKDKKEKEKILFEITDLNSVTLLDYTKEEIDKVIKSQLELINSNKCNSVLLDEKYIENYTLKSKNNIFYITNTIYSSVHECIWDIFYNELFLEKDFRLDSQYIFKCTNCKTINFNKGHFIKDNTQKNKNYKVYICDKCYDIRQKEFSKLRKERFNNKQKSFIK